MVRIEVKGLREIRAALHELPRRLERRLLNDGLLVGARLVRDEAKARAPILATATPRRIRGLLQRVIRAGRVRPENGMAATVWVRIRSLTKSQVARYKRKMLQHSRRVNAADNPLDPFYWRFVEFGTSKMKARPFLRPAFETKKEAAVRAAVARFRERIQAEVEKLGRMQPR